MRKGQFEMPEELHQAISRIKSVRRIGWSDWHILTSLVVLHLEGQCPDRAAAEQLCGGLTKPVALFGRMLKGEHL
jgi:hypothetical protein